MINYYQKLGINLDLAIEATEALRGDLQQEIPGVSEDIENLEECKVTTIRILNETGVAAMQKPIGTYITMESSELKHNNKKIHQKISSTLAEKIGLLLDDLKIEDEGSILVVGLGNWSATPDALGPKVNNMILVSRHIFNYAPTELRRGLREVSALTPGVLGITGIETAEIIRGVVERTKPAAIIAIDALAAANLNRVSSTIQLSNTGINPGSGIGNNRVGINYESMGVPVIAIGVPTVVAAATIALELFRKSRANDPLLTPTTESRMFDIIREVLEPFGGQLTVTPKEIDDLIDFSARIIAEGLNQALHPGITPENSALYLQ